MPLVRIDVNEGRSEREFRAIGDAIHEALVTTRAVPADDRFQVFTVPFGRGVAQLVPQPEKK